MLGTITAAAAAHTAKKKLAKQNDKQENPIMEDEVLSGEAQLVNIIEEVEVEDKKQEAYDEVLAEETVRNEAIAAKEEQLNNVVTMEDMADIDDFAEDQGESPASVPVKKVKKAASGSGESIFEKFKRSPMWAKAGAGLVVVFLVMLAEEAINPPASAPVALEENTTKPAEVKSEAPEPTKPLAEQKIEKLNSCMTAQQISYKYEGGGMIPFFGTQDISGEAVFCEEFILKNYKIDTANNNLSVVAEVYSSGEKVKSISTDPLAFFKPTYYSEGIGMKHPSGQEYVYMSGDEILTTSPMKLKLISIQDTGDSIVYNMELNGGKTTITIAKQYVQ